MSSKIELSPCPFCGGEPVLKQYRADGLEIKCSDCHSGRQQRWMYKGRDWLAEKMTEKWNERHAPPELAELQATIANQATEIEARDTLLRDALQMLHGRPELAVSVPAYTADRMRRQIEQCLSERKDEWLNGGRRELVAVVLPEREEVEPYWSSELDADFDQRLEWAEAKGFNRAIDKVKELNQ